MRENGKKGEDVPEEREGKKRFRIGEGKRGYERKWEEWRGKRLE